MVRILEGRIEISQDGENWTEAWNIELGKYEILKIGGFYGDGLKARYMGRITGVQTSPLNSSLRVL